MYLHLLNLNVFSNNTPVCHYEREISHVTFPSAPTTDIFSFLNIVELSVLLFTKLFWKLRCHVICPTDATKKHKANGHLRWGGSKWLNRFYSYLLAWRCHFQDIWPQIHFFLIFDSTLCGKCIRRSVENACFWMSFLVKNLHSEKHNTILSSKANTVWLDNWSLH